MAKIVNALDKFGGKSHADIRANANADKEKDQEDGKEEPDGDAEKEKEESAKPVAQWPEDYEETITETGGFKVHEWTITDPDKKDAETQSWSVAAGKALVSIGKIDLKEVVARPAKPDDAGSVAATAAWKSIPDSARNSDVLMGVNLESLLGDTQEMLRFQMEKGELNNGGLPINPLLAWLGAGLDQFRAAFAAITLEPEDAAMPFGLTYAGKPAILKIYAATGPGTPPAFIPSDVQEVSWGTRDWGTFYDNPTALAAAVGPVTAGGIEMGTAELQKQIGVDLRNDNLGQMGDAATGYACTIRLTADSNDIAIVDQCNARQPEYKLTVPVLADTDGDGKAELLFQEAGTAFRQILKKDPAGVWRATGRLEADLTGSSAAFALPLGKTPQLHLSALGRDRFWTAQLAGNRPALTLVASYETDQ